MRRCACEFLKRPKKMVRTQSCSLREAVQLVSVMKETLDRLSAEKADYGVGEGKQSYNRIYQASRLLMVTR